MSEEGDLRVWWIPQVPMDTSFYVAVKNIKEAILILDALANYDLFQLKHNIKPDYSNVGGLQIFEKNHEGNLEWSDYYDEDGRDIDELMEESE